MADIRQTPVSNYPAYYGAGLLNYINEAASKPFGYENDPVRALTNLLQIPSAVKTLENTAYGMPNVLGSGMATQLRPEAKETLANVLPMAPAAARLAAKGAVATGKYIAPQLGNMAEQYAARTGLLQSVKPIEPAKQTAEGLLEYRGSHTAPNAKVYGATIDNLGGIMPADVYSSKGTRLYGIGNPEIDSQWFSAAYKAKGKPDAEITVYRAVPKGVKNINSGDWVTTSKRYAQDHGESALNGEYEIVARKVKAKTLSSEGYPYEFGYNE